MKVRKCATTRVYPVLRLHRCAPRSIKVIPTLAARVCRGAAGYVTRTGSVPARARAIEETRYSRNAAMAKFSRFQPMPLMKAAR